LYIAIIFILLAGAAILIYRGVQRRSLVRTTFGVLLGFITILGFWFMDFWGEMLWFDALGYSQRFWLVALTKGTFAALGALFGLLAVYVLTRTVPKKRRGIRIGSRLVAVFTGGMWGLAHWDTLLRFLNSVSTDLRDPILGKDTGFYLFRLPFYDALSIFSCCCPS
jgi:uncharacterized membrane protein (UPF0182 family)